ncbi:unnamed protein product [Periconia digitata]|uniref:Uncharacterized protein n=1 Tax=Periconia digitata TaxID=1303443 RepID=A0A9W4UCR0_9PLEO|nr:unnamed protein product [Periconia digitata]
MRKLRARTPHVGVATSFSHFPHRRWSIKPSLHLPPPLLVLSTTTALYLLASTSSTLCPPTNNTTTTIIMSASNAPDYTLTGVQKWAEETFPSAFETVRTKTTRSHLWFSFAGDLDKDVYTDTTMLNIGMFVRKDKADEPEIRRQLHASLRKDGDITFTAVKQYEFSHPDLLSDKVEFNYIFRSIFLVEAEENRIRMLKSLCRYLYLKSDDHTTVKEFKSTTYIKPNFFKLACERVEEATITGLYNDRRTLREFKEEMRQKQHTIVIHDNTPNPAA